VSADCNFCLKLL